jgi:hypothetical protein
MIDRDTLKLCPIVNRKEMLKQFSGRICRARKSKVLAMGSNIQFLLCKYHTCRRDGLGFTATKE